MKNNFVPGVLIVLLTVLPAVGQETAESPYRITHPAEGITCFSPGLQTSPVTTCVIATDAGLVVIDTGLSPSMAKRTRQRIAGELGRDDICWVINTHSHFDHTGGNQVFADSQIIGHKNAVAAMETFYQEREAWIERRHGWLARQMAAAADAEVGSDQATALDEQLRFNHEMISDLQNSYRSTPPTVRFSDRLTLDAGGLEIQLLYFGRAHTDSDILVHIPALGALFTGDLFHDEVLGTASFSQPFEVARWLEVLDIVFADEPGIDIVIGGHGLLFSPEWIAAQRRYLGDVWQAVGEAKASEISLAEFSSGFPFDSRFNYVADLLDLSEGELADQHTSLLQSLWRVGQASAAEEIGRVSRTDGAVAARKAWAEIRTDNSFYIDEGELNALGYELLRGERKVAEALAVFEMNTQAFPDSWNVWDSFAEAHWWIDDEEGVERNYRKALELNPEAESPRRGIGQIEGHRLDRAGETSVASIFESGSLTDLEGPYFGQTPPGIEPAVFAPGVVSTAGGFDFSITFSPDGLYLFYSTNRDIYWVSTDVIHRLQPE